MSEMRKMRLNLANVLTVLLAALMVISAAPSRVYADDPTVEEYGGSISSKQFYEFELNRNNYDRDKSTVPTSFTLGEVGDTYVAYLSLIHI